MDKIVRRASHAGSWYSDNPQKLSKELEGWLTTSGLPKSPEVRGVIAPHAGYSYSGRAAAYAFGNIDPSNISRVSFLVHLIITTLQNAHFQLLLYTRHLSATCPLIWK
ncbi:unnamed protein product [Rhodiola kirilowii]